MLKIITLIFLIAGHVRSYVFEEPADSESDSLGNCAQMFPKSHIMRRACYTAHAVCRRHKLSPTIVNHLINRKVYSDIEMILPSGVSVPYSIYEAYPSLFDALYDKILIQIDPPISLQQYRLLINDSDFLIAKGIRHTSDQTLLTEMIEITLDHLHENDVTAIVGSWFQGDFKIIVPLIRDYLPELENITVVKIADNYPKLSEVKKVMNDRNITLEKVNPDSVSPVTNNGQEISVQKIRRILDFFKEPNNATVLPGLEYQALRYMLPIKSDAAVPIWQWMKVRDEIHSNGYQYQYFEKFPVIQLLPENEQTAASFPLDDATESITSTYESDVEDEIELENFSDDSSPQDRTCSSGESEDLKDCSLPILGSKNPKQMKGPREEVTDPLKQSSFPYENQKNEEYKMEHMKPNSAEGSPESYLLKQKNPLNSELGYKPRPTSENYLGFQSSYTTNYSKVKSAGEDTNSIQPHRNFEVNSHQTNGTSLQPHLQNSSQEDFPDRFSSAPFFLEKENRTTKFQNKIFTTCALYYLKVNGTQNRGILSEAGLLSLPKKDMCDELLHLETYNGNHTERLEPRDFKSLENPNLLAPVGSGNSQNSLVEPSINVHNLSSPSSSLDKLSESHTVKPFEVDSNRQVPLAAILAALHDNREGSKDEVLKNTPAYLDRPTGKSVSERNLRRNSLNSPNSPLADEKYDSFNRFSRRGVHQKIQKPARRLTRPFNRRFPSSPSHKIRSEDSFFNGMESFSDSRPTNPINRQRSRRLPKTS